ncbi:hypothetical protein ABG067_005979 [Albugo candida]
MALKLTFCILLLSDLVSVAQSHGHMVCPDCLRADKNKNNIFAARLDFDKVFPGKKFPRTSSRKTYDMFISVWNPDKLSLKDMVLKFGKPEKGADLNTGYCLKTAPAIKLPNVIYFGKNRMNSKKVEGVRHQGPMEAYCDAIRIMHVDDFRIYNNPGNKGVAKVKLNNTKLCTKAKTFQLYWLSTQAKDEGGGQAYIYYYNVDNVNGGTGYSDEDKKYCPIRDKDDGKTGKGGGGDNENRGGGEKGKGGGGEKGKGGGAGKVKSAGGQKGRSHKEDHDDNIESKKKGGKSKKSKKKTENDKSAEKKEKHKSAED